MKKVMTILTLAIFSTVVQAENSAEIQQLTESEPVMEGKAEINSSLWEMLDTDKDGSISKKEAASSREIFAGWDSLDSNKDGMLDTVEFSQFFSVKK